MAHKTYVVEGRPHLQVVVALDEDGARKAFLPSVGGEYLGLFTKLPVELVLVRDGEDGVTLEAPVTPNTVDFGVDAAIAVLLTTHIIS